MVFTHCDFYACILPYKTCTLAVHVALFQLVDSKLVGEKVVSLVELKLPQEMFAAYADENWENERVSEAKREHVKKMIAAVAESVILWICMENNVERASVVFV